MENFYNNNANNNATGNVVFEVDGSKPVAICA